MRKWVTTGSVAVAALALGACSAPPVAGDGNSLATVDNSDAATDMGNATAPAIDTGTTDTAVSGDTTSATDDTASSGTPDDGAGQVDDGKSAAAAAAVVERYYAAIDSGDFRTAYDQWGRDGQASQQSFAQFKNGFARTAGTSVTTDTPRDSEGAAGSIYITVPVTVDATLKDGTKQHFTGTYTLRRVNDVPGSSAEQRRWHLESADLTKG